jgi:uncharacterized protein
VDRVNALKVARGFTLPVDVAGEAIAILAKRGAGKTNTGRVLVEELVGAAVQTVVLDPVSAWWGLRAGADGKRGGGLQTPVLGGAHGDVPLQSTAGALLADVVVDTGQSLVLDLSDFSKTEQRRFVTDFAERLYQRKARAPQLLHVVLEEADEFAPQRVNAGDARMVGSIEQLVRRGRGRGIGLTMITQRSASLNKSILTQADVLIAMRTTGPQDRAAIAAWVEKQDVDGADDVVPSLSSLATGEAWIWNPERDLLKRVQIRLARTFDSSATAKAGQRRVDVSLAAIDLTKLGAEIEATAERAKENDPAELRKRVRELEREINGLHANAPVHEKIIVEPAEPVEIPIAILDPELVDRVEAALREAKRLGEELKAAGGALRQAADDNTVALQRTLKDLKEGKWNPKPTTPTSPKSAAPTAAASRATGTTPTVQTTTPSTTTASARRATTSPTDSGSPPDSTVTGAAAAVLAALAQFPDGRTKRQLAGLTGYRATGSTMRGALADLRKRGYCTPAGSGELILATPDGIAAASDVAPVPTGAALFAYWREKLGGASRAVFELLYTNPAGLMRDTIAVETGYEPTGSTMRGALAELRKYDLITQAGIEPIRVLDTLYDESQ